jgi:hypothetical protein
MNNFEVFLYFTCFSLIGGCAFAMMYANIQSIWATPPRPRKSQAPRHPEAPEPGEEVLYVNFDRERLEDIYKN